VPLFSREDRPGWIWMVGDTEAGGPNQRRDCVCRPLNAWHQAVSPTSMWRRAWPVGSVWADSGRPRLRIQPRWLLSGEKLVG